MRKNNKPRDYQGLLEFDIDGTSPAQRRQAQRVAGALMFAALILGAVAHVGHMIGKTWLDERASTTLTVISFAIIVIALWLHMKSVVAQLAELKTELIRVSIETDAIRAANDIRSQHHNDPLQLHVIAALDVIRAVHRTNFQTHFGDLRRFNDHSHNTVVISNSSTPFLYLEKIEELLPDGAVWFGVTHLTDAQVWREQSEKPEFMNFVHSMRTRSAVGTIRVFRVFCFGSDGDCSALEADEHVLSEEVTANIDVRIFIGGENKRPPDMSLIWLPEPGGRKPDAVDGIEIEASNLSLEALMRGKGYVPLCGLNFNTRRFHGLENVAIHSPRADEFRNLSARFKVAWGRSDKDLRARLSGHEELKGGTRKLA